MNPLNLKFVSTIKTNLKENLKASKKEVIPKIIQEIEKIRAPLANCETKYETIKRKLHEKLMAEQRMEINDDSFEEIKEREEKKTKFMIDEHKVLRNKNQDLSRIIEDHKSGMLVFHK